MSTPKKAELQEGKKTETVAKKVGNENFEASTLKKSNGIILAAAFRPHFLAKAFF